MQRRRKKVAILQDFSARFAEIRPQVFMCHRYLPLIFLEQSV